MSIWLAQSEIFSHKGLLHLSSGKQVLTCVYLFLSVALPSAFECLNLLAAITGQLNPCKYLLFTVLSLALFSLSGATENEINTD